MAVGVALLLPATIEIAAFSSTFWDASRMFGGSNSLLQAQAPYSKVRMVGMHDQATHPTAEAERCMLEIVLLLHR